MTQGHEDEPTESLDHRVFTDALFGARIVRAADPPERARQLADELSGEVVGDITAAEGAFAARADAGRADPVVLTESERTRLVESAARVDDGPELVATASTLADLREIAGELSMSERIRSNTEAEFVDSLNRRLSAASAVAVHPEAIRHAAAAVIDAEADAARYDAELAALNGTARERPAPTGNGSADARDGASGNGKARAAVTQTPAGTEAAEQLVDDGDIDDEADLDERRNSEIFDEEILEQNRRALGMAVGVAAFFGGAGLLLLQSHLPPVVPVLVFVIGLGLAWRLMIHNRSQGRVSNAELEVADLQAAGPAIESEPEGRPNLLGVFDVDLAADLHDEEVRMARRAHLETARSIADERVRSARSRWAMLAGSDVDPRDVEDLLRVRDPQFELVGAASRTSPTVRTVSAVHRRALARWRVAWAAVGYDEPPDIDSIDEHIDRLAALARGDDDAKAARDRLRTADAWTDACALIDRPILLVEPEGWLPAGVLESMMNALPAGAEVIVVEQESDESPTTPEDDTTREDDTTMGTPADREAAEQPADDDGTAEGYEKL
ncbi:MAG TPA: hypothetical protein VGJ03_17105 [Acidimicrobiales bacterium]